VQTSGCSITGRRKKSLRREKGGGSDQLREEGVTYVRRAGSAALGPGDSGNRGPGEELESEEEGAPPEASNNNGGELNISINRRR